MDRRSSVVLGTLLSGGDSAAVDVMMRGGKEDGRMFGEMGKAMVKRARLMSDDNMSPSSVSTTAATVSASDFGYRYDGMDDDDDMDASSACGHSALNVVSLQHFQPTYASSVVDSIPTEDAFCNHYGNDGAFSSKLPAMNSYSASSSAIESTDNELLNRMSPPSASSCADMMNGGTLLQQPFRKSHLLYSQQKSSHRLSNNISAAVRNGNRTYNNGEQQEQSLLTIQFQDKNNGSTPSSSSSHLLSSSPTAAICISNSNIETAATNHHIARTDKNNNSDTITIPITTVHNDNNQSGSISTFCHNGSPRLLLSHPASTTSSLSSRQLSEQTCFHYDENVNPLPPVSSNNNTALSTCSVSSQPMTTDPKFTQNNESSTLSLCGAAAIHSTPSIINPMPTPILSLAEMEYSTHEISLFPPTFDQLKSKIFHRYPLKPNFPPLPNDEYQRFVDKVISWDSSHTKDSQQLTIALQDAHFDALQAYEFGVHNLETAYLSYISSCCYPGASLNNLLNCNENNVLNCSLEIARRRNADAETAVATAKKEAATKRESFSTAKALSGKNEVEMALSRGERDVVNNDVASIAVRTTEGAAKAAYKSCFAEDGTKVSSSLFNNQGENAQDVQHKLNSAAFSSVSTGNSSGGNTPKLAADVPVAQKISENISAVAIDAIAQPNGAADSGVFELPIVKPEAVENSRFLSQNGGTANSVPSNGTYASSGTYNKQNSANNEYAVLMAQLERIPGVHYDKNNKMWLARIEDGSSPRHRRFSVSRFGFIEARNEAIATRNEYLRTKKPSSNVRQMNNSVVGSTHGAGVQQPSVASAAGGNNNCSSNNKRQLSSHGKGAGIAGGNVNSSSSSSSNNNNNVGTSGRRGGAVVNNSSNGGGLSSVAGGMEELLPACESNGSSVITAVVPPPLAKRYPARERRQVSFYAGDPAAVGVGGVFSDQQQVATAGDERAVVNGQLEAQQVVIGGEELEEGGGEGSGGSGVSRQQVGKLKQNSGGRNSQKIRLQHMLNAADDKHDDGSKNYRSNPFDPNFHSSFNPFLKVSEDLRLYSNSSVTAPTLTNQVWRSANLIAPTTTTRGSSSSNKRAAESSKNAELAVDSNICSSSDCSSTYYVNNNVFSENGDGSSVMVGTTPVSHSVAAAALAGEDDGAADTRHENSNNSFVNGKSEENVILFPVLQHNATAAATLQQQQPVVDSDDVTVVPFISTTAAHSEISGDMQAAAADHINNSRNVDDTVSSLPSHSNGSTLFFDQKPENVDSGGSLFVVQDFCGDEGDDDDNNSNCRKMQQNQNYANNADSSSRSRKSSAVGAASPTLPATTLHADNENPNDSSANNSSRTILSVDKMLHNLLNGTLANGSPAASPDELKCDILKQNRYKCADPRLLEFVLSDSRLMSIEI